MQHIKKKPKIHTHNKVGQLRVGRREEVERQSRSRSRRDRS